MREIVLKNGMVAIVDDEDFERLSAFRWSAVEGRRGDWYAIRMICTPATETESRRITSREMQRDVLDPDMTASRSQLSDHINHDTLDNRRDNLRWKDHRGSVLNRRLFLSNTSGYRGVYYDKHKRIYRATIRSFGKRYLSYHKTAEEAARAYNNFALIHHGEDAQLNIIPGDSGGE